MKALKEFACVIFISSFTFYSSPFGRTYPTAVLYSNSKYEFPAGLAHEMAHNNAVSERL